MFDAAKQHLELILLKNGVHDAIAELRKKWTIPNKGFKKLRESEKWHIDLYKKEKHREFNDDISILISKFRIISSFREGLTNYILFNKISSTKIKILHRVNGKNEELYLKIYPDTEIKDIEGIWNLIKFHKQQMWGIDPNKRNRNIKKFERNKRILELSKNKSDREIATIINEEYKESFIYSDIAKIRYKLKKQTDRS
ncbi:hypothetical protein ACFL3C_04375 [Patescibacteria group bacterium]